VGAAAGVAAVEGEDECPLQAASAAAARMIGERRMLSPSGWSADRM
jgi:hypothetical protein